MTTNGRAPIPDEKKAQRKARVDAIHATVLQLAEAIADPNQGDETFDQYLRFVSQFHHYSYNNVCSVLAHRPTASRIAGFRAWLKVGRHVKKGEKGIPILIPLHSKTKTVLDEVTGEETEEPGRVYFGLGHVFDVSQTEGDPLPNFKADLGEDGKSLLAAAVRAAQGLGFSVTFEPIFGDVNGYSNALTGAITLNSERSAGILCQTIIHECAHSILHRRALGEKQDPQAHALIEGEAEAVSVVVMHWSGHDTASNGAAYCRNHACSAGVIRGSLARISTCAGQIIVAMDAELQAAGVLVADDMDRVESDGGQVEATTVAVG